MKRVASAITLLLLSCMLAFAGGAGQQPGSSTSTIPDTLQPNNLPIARGDVTLSLYTFFPPGARQVYESLADHPVVRVMMEETGLNLKFVHPPENDDGTFFNVTIASGDYPDLMQNNFMTYPGGPDGAVEDGVLLNMNALINAYAPNYLALLAEQGPIVEKRSKSDTGMITRFGTIFQPPFLDGRVHSGLLARADWLETLNMDPPVTVDEYTAVLRAFKNDLGVSVPLALPMATDGMWKNQNVFASAFGVTHADFYHENGAVRFSRIQPGYRDYLELLAMYYREGLLDPDFTNRSRNEAVRLFQNGTAGITLLGNWQTRQSLSLGAIGDPDFDVVGLAYPRKGRGVTLGLSRQLVSVGDRAWFATATSPYPTEAVRFIDYLYMPETQILTAWGPGTAEYPTFEIVDGMRRFTNFITNNPNMDIETARSRYTTNPLQIMWEQDMEIQQYDSPYVHQAWDAWGYNNSQSGLLPNVITLTPDESREFVGIMNTVNTYTDEMFYKFVTGAESLATFDRYVRQVESFSIARAAEIQQAAYDRFQSR